MTLRSSISAYPRRLRQRFHRPSPRTLALGAMVLVAIMAFSLRFHHIRNSLPYPGQVDEPALTGPAIAILKTGDFNPHYFVYPSLSIYLIAGGMTLGYLDAARNEQVKTTKDIAANGYPYYTQSRIMAPPRLLFALLSVLGMVMMGLTAWRAFDDLGLIFLVPLILALSNQYAFLSQQYLNSDILGAFTTALVYVCLFTYRDREGYLFKSLIPGLLCGFAIGSKYNMALILLPALLVVLFFGGKQRLMKMIVLCAAAAAGFLITTPYSLLDFSAFLDALGTVFSHYAKGHLGNEEEPGLPSLLRYFGAIRNDMLPASAILAALGIVRSTRQNWRHALILLSFPVVLLLTMSQQRTFFVRNIIPVFMFYALFAAAGASWLYVILVQILDRVLHRPQTARIAATLLIALLLVVTLPSRRLISWASELPDTRTQASTWIRSHAEPKDAVIVPSELGMDVRSLEKDYTVVVLPFSELTRDDFYRAAIDLGNPFILQPEFNSSRTSSKDKTLGDRLNTFAEGLDAIDVFEGTRVQFVADYYPPVAQGNPEITIARLALSEDAKANLWRDRVFEVAQMQGRKKVQDDGTLFLTRNVDLRTPRFYLPAGSYGLLLDAKGTEVEGVPAILEVFVDDKLIAKVETTEAFKNHHLDFRLDSPVMSEISIRFLNSESGAQASDGKTASRNASLRRLELEKVD